MDEAQRFNGYRFAALARGESLQSPDVCECCGREGLKKTVKLINPEGRPVWFGVGCAARAMGTDQKTVKARKQAAEDAAVAAERAQRAERSKAGEALLQAFLDRAANAPKGIANRGRQIEAFGGWPKMVEAFRSQDPEGYSAWLPLRSV